MQCIWHQKEKNREEKTKKNSFRTVLMMEKRFEVDKLERAINLD